MVCRLNAASRETFCRVLFASFLLLCLLYIGQAREGSLGGRSEVRNHYEVWQHVHDCVASCRLLQASALVMEQVTRPS